MLTPELLVQFALALIRFTTFFLASPVFNRRNIPTITTIGLSSLIAIFVSPTLELPQAVQSLGALMLLALHEVAVGLLLGFVVILVFGIIQFAGQLADVPIGFGMASIFDPATGTQMPVFSQFYYIVAVLVFFAGDGHLWLIQGLSQSYLAIPFTGLLNMEVTYETFLSLAGDMFLVGMKLSLPVMATILLVDIGLGIVVRAVPQINVFVIGFPIKILVGMMIITAALPIVVTIVSQLFSNNGLLISYLRTLFAAGGS